jgi:predicted transcriptional regulator YheO
MEEYSLNDLLRAFIPTANAIVGTFGNDCEVVIHDLTTPENSVVYVSNGIVTGRRPGQSFDHLVRQVLLNKDFKNDNVVNYTFTTEDGRLIKSSSALIRDQHQEVVGMICINFDITNWKKIQSAINQFLSVTNEKIEKEVDVNQDVMSIIDEIIHNIVGERDLKDIKRRDAIELVRFMDDKGIFLVKGTIDKIANLLGVSKVTIYSYLDEAKKSLKE